MVQLTVHVRPKNGYTYAGKIKSITVDSSTRLEQVVADLKLDTKKGISLYAKQGKRELALNTSLASNNVQTGDILETCACPQLAAVLSLVLRDMNSVEAIPEDQRTQARLEPLLGSIDPWQADRWDDESIKSRIICMATMKSLLQRQDRFADVRVQPCSTLVELYTFLQTTRAFSESSSRPRRGSHRCRSHNSMARLFKPSTNRDGRPSTVWQLLHNKLQRMQQAGATTTTTTATPVTTATNSRGMRNNQNPSSISSCPIETCLRQEAALTCISTPGSRRRKAPPSASSADSPASGSRKRRRIMTTTLQSPSTRWQDQERNCATCSTATPATCMCLVEACPFVRQPSCTFCFSSNHPTRTVRGNHTCTALTEPAVKAVLQSMHRQRKQDLYCPQYASGPFAILCTLFTQVQEHAQHSLTESRLKELAQRICRSNLYDHQGKGRNAFACIEGLMEKNLVRMERVPSQPNHDSEEGIYSLLPDGEDLARYCYLFQKRVDTVIPLRLPYMRYHDIPPRHLNPITVIVDTREDSAYTQRFGRRCQVEQVPWEHRELPAGDYLFLVDGKVCPIVVERKTWLDLADSVLGKGRKQRRLDCVAIGTNNQHPKHCENGRCQLCKMKASGCTKVMFLIEGARCRNSEDNPDHCTAEHRCEYCRDIQQKHGHRIAQAALEEALLKLQVEHGCFVHYTRSYNESIDVLLTIRDILGQDLPPSAVLGQRTSLESSNGSLTLSYEEFCANARRKGTDTNDKHPKLSTIVEWDDAAFVTDIGNGDVQASVQRLVKEPKSSSAAVKVLCGTSSQPEKSRSIAQAASESHDIVVLDGLTRQRRNKQTPRASGTDEVIVLDDVVDDNNNARALPSVATPSSEVVVLDSDDDSSDGSVHVVDASEIEVISPSASRDRSKQSKLILITGLYQYDAEFYKDLSYQNHKASASTDFAACCQAQLTPNQHGDVPLVRRENIMFWLVQLQMSDYHVEVPLDKTKTRHRLRALFRMGRPLFPDAAESPSGHAQSETCRTLASAGPPAEPECMIVTNPSRTRTPTTSVVTEARKHIAVASEHRKPPAYPSSRKIDPRREHERLARLARFEKPKHANTIQCPNRSKNMLADCDGWSCRQCTFVNSAQPQECEICGAPKLGEWTCSVCTLVNPSTSSFCSACDTASPNSGLAITTIPLSTNIAVARGVAASGDVKRKIKCGACGAVGHNRASANASNCAQYSAPAEVDRRNKIREKKEKEAWEAQQSIVNHQRQQTSLTVRLEETRRALAQLEQAAASDDALRTNEIKRLEKQKKRAQKQAQKYS